MKVRAAPLRLATRMRIFVASVFLAAIWPAAASAHDDAIGDYLPAGTTSGSGAGGRERRAGPRARRGARRS